MSDLEQKAIERIKTASEMSFALYKKPLVFTDSGGKDSAVICKLAENAGIPFEIIHSHTTADAPPTVYHVRKRAKMYEDKGIKYTILHPMYKGEQTSMWKLIPQKMIPPTRLARYCCQVLKEAHGRDRFIATGVRWAESNSRANNRGVLEIEGSIKAKKILLNNDNDEDRRLFESCQIKGKRVGCVGCPMASKNRYSEFARFPKFKQMYINAFGRMLKVRKEQGKNDTTGLWTDAQAVFHWWMEDGVLPNQIGFEDLG